MAVGELPRPDIRLAEDVAVLSILKALPGETLSNPLPSHVSAGDNGRTLSFSRELFLSSGLASLAEISDDPNHIVAVAIQEKPETQRLAVVVAINKANPTSAEGALKKIKQGLQDIFGVLARVGHGDDNRLQYDVFRAIIRLCGTRILLRLCSKRVKPSNAIRVRQYFGNTLNDVRNGVVISSAEGRFKRGDRPLVDSFLAASEALGSLLQELETCPERSVNRKLASVMSTSRRINKNHQLHRLLRTIPNRYLDPNTRDGFLTRLGELARYVDLSRHLCQTAKNNILLRNIEVVDVRLDDEHFARAICPPHFSGLDECLGRCVHGEMDTDTLCQSLGMTVSQATGQLLATARKGVTESKIHAEIQIAAYYEINPTDLPPRTICSNKDACYLCDEFIKLQGKYYIPRSHGKLYPGWRVPPLRVFNDTQSQLIKALESKINSHHHHIVHARRPRVPGPKDWSERADVHFSDSMSTLPSLLSSESLSSLSQDSFGEIHDGNTDVLLLATQDFEPSLPTIAEVPARLPAPDDSSDSDASTLKPEDGREAMDGDGTWKPDQPADTTPRAEGDREPIHVAGNTLDEDTAGAIDKGKAKAKDDNEASISLREGDNNGELQRDEVVAAESPRSENDSVEETASVRSDNARSLGTPQLADNTPNTSTEEPEAGDFELSERRRGKQPAESLTESEDSQEDIDGVDAATMSPIVLSRGDLVVCQLSNNQALPRYTAGLLTVIPEFVRGDRCGRSSSTCELRVEWLTDDEANKVTKAKEKVTDVETMEQDIDIDSGSPDLIILAQDTTILRFHIIRS